jgi:RNase E specificity factor CsrD
MYSYSKLLVRNLGLGFLFYFCITLITLLMFTSHIKDKQALQSKMITSIAKQSHDKSENKALAKTLQNVTQFTLLNITTLTGDSLFYKKDKTQRSSFEFMLPKSVSIRLKKQNLIINFQLAYKQDISFLIKLLLILLSITVFFCVVVAFISSKRYQKLYSGIGQQIKRQISVVVNNEKTNGDDDYDITGLKDGITEIKALIKTQQTNSQELEKKAFTDSITGLGNRNKFIRFFEHKVGKHGDVKFGVLIITRCSELQIINKIRGFSDGDRYINKVAKIMKSTLLSYNNGQIFRMNSSDFATVLPNVQIADGENYAKELTSKFNEYQHASELDSVAYTGIVAFSWQSPLGELLALADTSISIAQTQNINAWFAQKDSNILKDTSAGYGNQNWRQEIDNVIKNRRISLLVQPIQPNSRNSKVYGEVLARFLNSNDEMLPTASFIAMAEKLDKIVDIDQLIIETAIDEIKNKNLLEKSFGLNISARSMCNEHFLIWLERRLLKEYQVASRLVFEITEYGLQQNIKSSLRFIDMLHRSGARITVERFGVSLTSFKFFRDLKPDFIKMDSTYTRDIDEDKNNQYFLRLMVDLAHRLSINVLAESVETLEEKHTLEKLFVDGCQGYYINKPMTL